MNPAARRAMRRIAERAISRLTFPGSPRDSILCWHSVHPDLPFRSSTPEEFRAELERIAETCDVATPAALLEPGGGSRPRVALTFDDGYLDNYEYAFPIVAERGLPAVFFITAGFVDGDPATVARFRMLRRRFGVEPKALTWSQVREMAEAGMEIGCHSFSHAALRFLTDAEVELELSRGKEIIEQRLGRAVQGLAYPFGKPGCTYGSREVAAAKRLGFRYAATTVRRRLRPGDSPWELPRLSVEGDGRYPVAEQIAGRWDWIGVYNTRAPAWLARRLDPRGFDASIYGGSHREMAERLSAGGPT